MTNYLGKKVNHKQHGKGRIDKVFNNAIRIIFDKPITINGVLTNTNEYYMFLSSINKELIFTKGKK